ncbi:hypothetical protein BGZ76_005885, partial [Entomortierella beljakovae]
MDNIIKEISTLAKTISADASKVEVDNHACMQLARKVLWVEKEVREKGPKCKKTSTLRSIEQLLVQCASKLRKHELVSDICERHMEELDFWMDKIEQAVKDQVQGHMSSNIQHTQYDQVMS